MSEVVDIRQFEVIGQFDGMQADKAAPRFLLMSADGLSGVMARREGDRFIPMEGPFSWDTIHKCAVNVLAGDQRAIDWKHTQAALAIGCATFFTLYGRGTGALPSTPEEASI